MTLEKETSELLNDILFNLFIPSLKQKKKLYEQLLKLINIQDLTEDAVLLICSELEKVLFTYSDRKSQVLLHGIIGALLKNYEALCLQPLITSVRKFASYQVQSVTTYNTSQSSLAALQWTRVIIKQSLQTLQNNQSELLKNIIVSEALLLESVTEVSSSRLSIKARKTLYTIWTENGSVLDIYASTLTKVEPSVGIAVLASCFLHYAAKKQELISKYKEQFLEIFVKVIISSRNRPNLFVIYECKTLLSVVQTNEFDQILLPPIMKAMLRNPEIILECISHVILYLPFDLGKYVLDIGKHFSTSLYSQTDRTRDEAADGLLKLADKCSDVGSLNALLKHLFNVFNGSEGKLSLASQKISVLQGVGNLSHNVAPNELLLPLMETIVNNFIKIIEIEVHEKTLVHAVEMLTLWCRRFTWSVVPSSLISCFQKKLASKNSLPWVNAAIVECLYVCFTGDRMLQGLDVAEVLLKCFDKAISSHMQVPALAEGLSIARLLLKLSSMTELENRVKLTQFWNTVLDMNKAYFVSEKLLIQASANVLSNVLSYCEFLICNKRDKLTETKSPLYKAVIFCALSKNLDIRNHAKDVILKYGNKTETDVISELICEYTKYINNIDLKSLDEETFPDRLTGQQSLSYNSQTTKKLLTETMLLICTGSTFDAAQKQIIAMNSLIPTHHPNLKYHFLWTVILTRLNLKPTEFVRNNEKKINKMLIDDFDGSKAAENALSTITNIQPESIIPPLMKKCGQVLESNDLLSVTEEQYCIYLTPEGELYNKSMMVELQKTDNDPVKNMKRESKAYSFKEQQEEMQLRKEIEEEKKKKAGYVKEPELSDKQKELVKQELEKEAAIRTKLQVMNRHLNIVISLIRGAAAGNGASLSLRFRFLLPLILRNMRSPLAAKQLCDLFIELRKCVFPPSKDLLAIFISYLTLRYEQPKCELDKAWVEENLGKASQRALELLIFTENFSGPTFAYFFWFLKNLMLSSEADVSIMMDVLKIISKHAEIRGRKVGKKLNLNSPKLLPRSQMFEALIAVTGEVGGFLQQTATKTLIQVAASCSTDEGCDPASTEELNCLLTGLQSYHPGVRDACMKALEVIISAFPSSKKDHQTCLKVTKRVWVARHDVHAENRELAENVWNKANLDLQMNNLAETLLEDIISTNPDIQEAAAKALTTLLEQLDSSMINTIVRKLMNVYQEKLKLPKSKKDEFGRVVEAVVDPWECRNGVALAFEQLAPLITNELVTTLINFYVQTGLRDSNEQVQGNMLLAGVTLVSLKGKEYVSKLLPIFENFLKKTPASGDFDAARSSVIVLMGTLARHLDSEDPKLKPIVNKLIEALSTPSQQVQESVAESLHPLVTKIKEEAPAILKKLMNRLLNGTTYGDRKGAAYGIAAVVKGVGILSLKQFDIMSTLTEAIQDKKNYKHREGALFALEQLCRSIGRLFEPYIIHILPHLLLCFGDNSEYVRTAADECAKVVMSKLSGHGVKLVLPALLKALEDDSWRTKTGSVELLGAMAFCAPKQLSSCLPSIVPKLIEVLSDSHIKVQEAGAQALRVIGSVIRNPEIQAIVNTLLDALQDPPNKIAICLSTLLNTKFIHFIDAPSLALIMPVVHRAFMDRSTETRKMAAQIIGNMYSLTDEKDLTPYLPTIMPGLKNSLLDPVPEVRSVSARALGAMVRGMGESSFEDLLPWLMKTLTSEASSVDRSGAAQGLSEVVGGLGLDKLHKLMPEIISTADRSDIAPHVKDGYLMMFIYMPAVFGVQFTPYIGQIIVPILKALADENEYVRETALKAGQRIVNMYAESAIQLLLPELEKGLFDDNWRIRFSSVQLLGDLLYRISGVTGKMSTETANEDDNFGTEHSHKIIITALGEERRNRVLAGLYMGRSDVSLLVRQAALHVWKVVVTNTPRTLREILTTLFGLLLGCLASPNFDKRQVGARTLGDLVRKLGERVLPEIIPLLEKGLKSDDPEVRQGVCIGLSEIVKSTSRDMVLAFINNLIPTVRKTLCDPLPEVRRAAAKTFDSLHTSVGVRALDDILPYMLQLLKGDDPEMSERALDGLRQVMAIKSRAVLPYLIPQLTAPPINTKVLAILASVAGDALTKYLHKILPALLKVVASPDGECEMEYCQAVVLAVVDESGIRVIMDQLQEATKSENPNTRKAAINLLSSFCLNTKGDYSQYVPQLLRIFIHLLTDRDEQVLQLSWEALNAVTKSLNSDQQIAIVSDVRQAMRHAANEIEGKEKILPGFCLRKGISPLIPIFREAMLNGTTEIKEQGALGLGEAIKLSSKEALQVNVVAITGPLIRAVGERFVGNVKAAVIETLAILLDKVGLSLKQFLPQLQTTFLKSLVDPHRQVRLKAAFALSRLVLIHGKADPLFLELYTAVKTTEDSSIKETILHTLRVVIIPAGDRMSDQVRRSLFMMLRDMLGHNEDTTRSTAAAALACLMRWLSAEQLNVILAEHILVDEPSLDTNLKHGRSTALFVALKENANYVYTGSYIEKINRILIAHLQAPKVSIVLNGIRGCGYLFLHLLQTEQPIPSTVLVPFARSINHANNDVKQLLAKVSSFLARSTNKLSMEFLKTIVPMLVNGTKEKNTFVKANCEFALTAVLRLKEGDTIHQECMKVLDAGARESLNDVVVKVLKRLATSQFEGKEEDLDDTLLN